MARVGSSRLPLDFSAPPDDRLRRLGELLRSTRLARDEELSHAAAWLKIRPAYLAALEGGDLAAMPGPVYATGFLRSYADHLGLDGAELTAPLKAATVAGSTTSALVRPRPRRLPDPASLAAALILMGAAAAGYGLLGGNRSPLDAMQSEGRGLSLLSADAGTASAAEGVPIAILASIGDETSLRPSPGSSQGGRVTLVGHGAAWVRLSDATGNFVRAWSIATGDRVALPSIPGMVLSTGDAGNIEILVDGRSMGMAGAAATVVRDLALDPEALLTKGPAS
jgi:cytoskeleton protein RodZ